jgi:spermidine synthase
VAARAGGPVSFPAALLAAALCGFVGLSWELLWFRTLDHVTGSAPWVFGALLGAYLAGLGLASLGARALCARRPRPGAGEVRLAALVAALAAAAAYLTIPALAALAVRGAWPWALPLLALAAGLLGAVFPLAAHFAIAPDDRAGARLSFLYVADIAGSALGSAGTGYVLLEHLSTREASVLLAALGFGLAALLGGAAASGRRALLPAAAALAASLGAALLAPPLFDRLWERLQLRQRDDGSRFVHVVENRHGVVTVTADGVVHGGGVYDGTVSLDPVHDRNGIFRAYAVSAMHPAPRRVLLVGLGSGSWAAALASLPGVEALTIVEINPAYLEVIRARPEVAFVLDDPRVEVVVDDARRWLARHPERAFDAIVANVTVHWRAHSTGLLSAEFVELARARLAPGGLYFFNTTFFRPARETALRAFGHGRQVGTFVAAAAAPIPWDGPRLAAALTAARPGGRPVVDPSSTEGAAFLAGLAVPPSPPLRPDGSGPVVTDDNMLPEWRGLHMELHDEGHVTRGRR